MRHYEIMIILDPETDERTANATPEIAQELDRQLGLNETVLRTKLLRPEA